MGKSANIVLVDINQFGYVLQGGAMLDYNSSTVGAVCNLLILLRYQD